MKEAFSWSALCTTALIVLPASVLAQSASAPSPAVASAPAAASADKPPAPPAAKPPAAAAATGSEEGKVAHYGRKFAGRKTASGERFNPEALTMAHVSLPFGTRVKVTNLKNQRSVIVRVNDRGPSTAGRVGDLSTAAARRIGMLRAGVVDAKLEVVAPVKPKKAA